MAKSIVDRFLVSLKKAYTRRDYRGDLVKFANYVGADDPDEAALVFLFGDYHEANRCVNHWVDKLVGSGLSPKTINRRIVALTSFLRWARLDGLTTVCLDVDTFHINKHEVRKRLTDAEIGKICNQVACKFGGHGIRDTAIVHLMLTCGLGRQDILSLMIDDFDAERVLLTYGKTTWEGKHLGCLVKWVDYRGTSSGPLFLALDRSGHLVERPLSGSALYGMVSRLAEKCGVKCSPRILLNTCLAIASESRWGDTRSVQEFSRLNDGNVIIGYERKAHRKAKLEPTHVAELVAREIAKQT
jgi:integrase